MAAPRSTPLARRALLLAALALPAGAPGAQAPGTPAPGAPAWGAPAIAVRAGTSVSPDTVTVGDPFVVQVRVQAPAGATVTFPAGPDSGATVALLDPRRVSSQPVQGADGVVDHLAVYRVAAWDVDDQPIPLGGDVVVRMGAAERRVPLAGLRVHVRSVLPADTALRVPKPVRAPLADAGPWWLRYWPWALLALALIALVWWLLRRWLRRKRELPRDAAYRRAVAEFERLSRMGLIEAGERGRFVALAVEVLRDYVAARLPGAPTSMTSSELLHALAGRAEVPHDRLARLLEAADLVKFAALPIGGDDARAAGAEARAIVDAVELRVRERERQEAEAAAARERADRAAAKRYEDERRRAA